MIEYSLFKLIYLWTNFYSSLGPLLHTHIMYLAVYLSMNKWLSLLSSFCKSWLNLHLSIYFFYFSIYLSIYLFLYLHIHQSKLTLFLSYTSSTITPLPIRRSIHQLLSLLSPVRYATGRQPCSVRQCVCRAGKRGHSSGR